MTSSSMQFELNIVYTHYRSDIIINSHSVNWRPGEYGPTGNNATRLTHIYVWFTGSSSFTTDNVWWACIGY